MSRFLLILLLPLLCLVGCANQPTTQITNQRVDFNKHTTCIHSGRNNSNDYREIRLINFNEQNEMNLDKVYIMISDGKSTDAIPIYLVNEAFVLKFLEVCNKTKSNI